MTRMSESTEVPTMVRMRSAKMSWGIAIMTSTSRDSA